MHICLGMHNPFLVHFLLCVPAAFLVSLLGVMSKTHAASRTIADWVVWARGEGFIDIEEHAPDKDPVPGWYWHFEHFLSTALFQAKYIVHCVQCRLLPKLAQSNNIAKAAGMIRVTQENGRTPNTP